MRTNHICTPLIKTLYFCTINQQYLLRKVIHSFNIFEFHVILSLLMTCRHLVKSYPPLRMPSRRSKLSLSCEFIDSKGGRSLVVAKSKTLTHWANSRSLLHFHRAAGQCAVSIHFHTVQAGSPFPGHVVGGA